MNANDPRVKRTRKLLQESLYALMRDKSFEAITVQDIAGRATVNRATFYAHYHDKHALIDDIIREDFRQALERSMPPTSSFTSGSLRTLCRTVFEYMARMQDHCSPSDQLFNPLFDRAVQEVLSTFLQGLLTKVPSGGGPRRASLSTTSTVVSWAIFGAGALWSRGPRTPPADELATQVVSLLTNVIAGSANGPVSERLEQAASSRPGERDTVVAP